MMGGDNCGEILAVLRFADCYYLSGWGSGCCCPAGRCAGALNPCVHICLVIIADIYHPVPALEHARKGLNAYVVGTPVSSKGDEVYFFVEPALFS